MKITRTQNFIPAVLAGALAVTAAPRYGLPRSRSRIMQPVSDIFLGWAEGRPGHNGYIRQLRDIKIKFAIEMFGKAQMLLDAGWCGHTLALKRAIKSTKLKAVIEEPK
jgi:hypothetical protein